MRQLHKASTKIKSSQQVVGQSLKDRPSLPSLAALNQKLDREQAEKLRIDSRIIILFDAVKTGGVSSWVKTGQALAVMPEHKEWQHDLHHKATV